MVKAVYVHTPDKSNGHREQQIDISYDLVGILPRPCSLTCETEKRHSRSYAVSRKQLYAVFMSADLSGGFLFTRKFRWNHLLYLDSVRILQYFLRKFSLIKRRYTAAAHLQIPDISRSSPRSAPRRAAFPGHARYSGFSGRTPAAGSF